MSIEKQAVLEAVEAWVQEILDANGKVAHGWPHTDRVRQHIRVLAPAEGVDPVLAELAALLHDIGRTQPGSEDEHGARSAAMAEPLLAALPLSDSEREAVLHAVRWHNSARSDTPLLCILRDADMLDGLGAIGIMRGFMSKGHLPPYNSGRPFEQDHACWPSTSASDQILGQMRFYNWLNTETARRMARDRIAFMNAFLSQARKELSVTDA
jgi:uncharacterized protein